MAMMGASYSNAIGDIDNDGYPEIIVMNNNFEEMYLWKMKRHRKTTGLKTNWKAQRVPRMGIGSWIRISAGGQEQYHYTLMW